MTLVDTVSMMWLEGMDLAWQGTRKTIMEHHCLTSVPMGPLSKRNESGRLTSVLPSTPG